MSWLRLGTCSALASVIPKGNIICKVKTIEGTPRVPVGAPGMGNEYKLTFRLAHMTESGTMMKRNEDRLYPLCAHSS